MGEYRNSGGYGGGGGRSSGGRGGFGGGNSGGGRSSRARGGFGGGFSNGPREMHDATCGECGNECQVPFLPSNDKPVLCSNCFSNSKGNDRPSRGFNNDSRRSSFDRNDDRRSESRHQPKPVVDHTQEISELRRHLDKANKKLDLVIELVKSIAKSHDLETNQAELVEAVKKAKDAIEY